MQLRPDLSRIPTGQAATSPASLSLAWKWDRKRVELAHQLVPNASALAMLINSKFPMASAEMRDMQGLRRRSLGLETTVVGCQW